MSHGTPESSTCYNCGAELHGQYCAACGQEARPLNPTLSDFVHDFTHELLHVDGRIFRSMRNLLFVPGFLTREYFEGRRARWVAPIRLYLIFSVLYFALTALAPETGFLKVTKTGDNDAETTQAIQSLGYQSEHELREAMSHAQSAWMPRVMFVLVPLYAWLARLVVRRKDMNFPQYLYFALHVHAAWFGGLALVAAASWALPDPVAIGIKTIVLVYAAGYAVLALRRVFGLRTAQAVIRSTIVLAVYWVATMAALLAIIAPVFFGHR